jgi:hypothetical protein
MTSSITVRPAGATARPVRRRGYLGRWALAALIAALAIMIGASLVRSSLAPPPPLPMPGTGPPFELSAHVPARLICVLLWVGGTLATACVLLAMIAIRRGQRLPIRALLIVAAIGVLALIVLPPAGSTDTLDYSVYGHIAALGRSPYLLTPYRYRLLYHVAGIPLDWQHDPSYYGPLATAEEVLAVKLGGALLSADVFWLKLINALAFGAVALLADRVYRHDVAGRLRAHVLWTANPLLIWALIAGGHLDVLAAAIGVAGLLACDRWHTVDPRVRALVAGLCVGVAADIKLDYGLFAAALLLALSRRPRELLVAGAAFCAVLIPSYVALGMSAINAVAVRAARGSGYGFYGTIFHHLGIPLKYSVPAAVILMVPVGWLALTRLPRGVDGQQAIRVALAFSLVWLLLWPHQYAWYSVMIFVVLIFYPASRLDWLAVAWFGAITVADMPGLGIGGRKIIGPVLTRIQAQLLEHVAPLVMLAAAVALVLMCLSGQWRDPSARGLRLLSTAPAASDPSRTAES